MIDESDLSYQNTRQKIIFIGNVSVGKTSIINSILGRKFKDEYEPSIGIDFFSKNIKYKSNNIKLQLWDSAGQEKFKSLIPNYIRGSSLVFLVYDITNKKSFDDLLMWINFINQIESTQIVLCANKIDLKEQRIITYEQGEKFSFENKCIGFYEVSAKEDKLVNKMLFDAIAELFCVGNYISERTTKEEIIHDLTIENNGDVSTSQQTDTNEGVSKVNNIVNNNNKQENNSGNQIESGKIGEKLRNIRKSGMKKICKC
jgi:Ras-related protein Rab-6A